MGSNTSVSFKFKVSKLANQFFFISNLSEWHFSCRPEYNKKWIEMTGQLSKKEKRILSRFKKLMSKYGYISKNGKEIYLGYIFYKHSDSTAWKKLRQFVSKSEYVTVKEVFKEFSPRFEEIWRKLGQKEMKRRIRLLKTTLHLSKNQKIIRLFRTLFDHLELGKVNIIVIFSPLGVEETAAGSANIGDSALTFEVPSLQRNTLELDLSIGTLFHEVVHLFLRRAKAEQIICGFIRRFNLPAKLINKSPISTMSLINEILASSFAPTGYLMRKFYGKGFSKEIFSPTNLERMEKAFRLFRRGDIEKPYLLVKYFAWKLQPLISQHINAYKRLDTHFIAERITRMLKQKK